MKKFASVYAYIAAAPKEARAKLKQMRAVVQALAPGAEEKISYGMPGYKYRGRFLVYFAGYKKHIGFYPMSGMFFKPYAAELKKYQSEKGTLRFPLEKPLPVALIRTLIKAKMKINENTKRGRY